MKTWIKTSLWGVASSTFGALVGLFAKYVLTEEVILAIKYVLTEEVILAIPFLMSIFLLIILGAAIFALVAGPVLITFAAVQYYKGWGK